MSDSALEIARELLRCPSVTPADAGALGVLEQRLKAAGFDVQRVTFHEDGTDDIDNLFAKIGFGAPHLTFAGHTDVVPAGDETKWSLAPFAGDVKDGTLYGRGAVDMKGGIAAFVAAALDYLKQNGGKPKGTISFLITGDEESVAVNGTIKLLDWAAKRGEKFDHCLLGEPTGVKELGDCVKIGRRGSQNATLIVEGTAGHVAYPERANNPIPAAMAMIAALNAEKLDDGTPHFQPSNLEFTSVDVGNPTVNVIPGAVRAKFNIRYNDLHTNASLRKLVEQRAAKATEMLGGKPIVWRIEWMPSNVEAFRTRPGAFTDMVVDAIKEVTGRTPDLNTLGGTSDARFITNYCDVLEFGLVGQTMHGVDERTPVADLDNLTRIYRRILERYFA